MQQTTTEIKRNAISLQLQILTSVLVIVIVGLIASWLLATLLHLDCQRRRNSSTDRMDFSARRLGTWFTEAMDQLADQTL